MKNGRKLVKVDCIRRWLEDRNVGASSNVRASRLDSGSYASVNYDGQRRTVAVSSRRRPSI